MEIIRVFIVEDDPMVASINKQFTEKLSLFQVIGASASESEALQKIKELQPDLVLLDIMLLDGSGLNLLKLLRYENIQIDFILITAARDTATIREAFRYGAIDYVIKPFEYERLQQALANYISFNQFFKEHTVVSQEQLDNYNHLMAEGGLSSLSSLPKGVHYLTLKQLLKHLDSQDSPLSCQQIADALTLSKITAWRYLEYLVDRGKVEVTLEYGAIGRPTKHYRIVR